MKERRLLVSGDRNWTDAHYIFRLLRAEHGREPIHVLIEGEANGVDKIFKACADRLGILVLPYKAEWKKYGRGAGPKRNKQMLKEGMPTELIAVHEDLTQSKGTANMIEFALRAGIPVKIFPMNDKNRKWLREMKARLKIR
jgi:SLOG family YspA-like protein